jgi:hypothetical protein
VLKTPAHLGYLDTLLTAFPDAHLVYAHRDPVEVIPSGASLNATLWRTHCDEVDPAEVGRQWLERMGWACDRALRSRDGIPPGRVTDVTFEAAVADPLRTAARVLTDAGLDPSPTDRDAMAGWLTADRAREALPVHRYTAEEFGLTDGAIRERFLPYTERFL